MLQSNAFRESHLNLGAIVELGVLIVLPHAANPWPCQVRRRCRTSSRNGGQDCSTEHDLIASLLHRQLLTHTRVALCLFGFRKEHFTSCSVVRLLAVRQQANDVDSRAAADLRDGLGWVCFSSWQMQWHVCIRSQVYAAYSSAARDASSAAIPAQDCPGEVQRKAWK